MSAARPWQRLRPSLLLLLQLLAVAGLALAAARPVRLTDARVADHTVLHRRRLGLDGRPRRRPRLARRRQGPRPAGSGRDPRRRRRQLVVADDRPRVASPPAPTGPRSTGARPLEATAGAADFAGAFVLAESLETTGDSIAFVLVSDGGLTDAEQAPAAAGQHLPRHRRPVDQPGHHPPHRRAGEAGLRALRDRQPTPAGPRRPRRCGSTSTAPPRSPPR